MLHRRRKRLQELASQEAAGASFWTDAFDETTRIKLVHAFRDSGGDYHFADYASFARRLILRDEGLIRLMDRPLTEAEDFLQYVLHCPDEMMPTVIEAMVQAVNNAPVGGIDQWEARNGLPKMVSVVLREHRISFDLIDGRMVEFSSREMHDAVMVPTLQLLAGRPELASVESAYRDALDEISKNKPGDAITDAGTALQETLVALGCDGNALGPLTKSARAKGLFAGHDSPLVDVIEKTMHWVSADRSVTGDAHQTTTATSEDAWFTVHVVGALILRLVQGGPRAARPS